MLHVVLALLYADWLQALREGSRCWLDLSVSATPHSLVLLTLTPLLSDDGLPQGTTGGISGVPVIMETPVIVF